MGGPAESEHRFISFDETPIFYHVTSPAGAPRAAVMLVHGMGEHGGRYLPLARYLTGLDLLCVVPDLRGFGRSGGPRGHVRRLADFHRDLAALHQFTARTHKGAPFFLLGHSFGGLLLSSYVAQLKPQPVQGLVLTSPIFGIALPVPLWRHWLGVACSALAPGYTQDSRIQPEQLTHDPEIIARYRQDALIHHQVSARLYRELVGGIAQKEAIARGVRLPVLVLQAGEDQIVSRPAAVAFYHALASEDKELEVYEGFYHEILNETGREKVFNRIGQWILKRMDVTH